jgi:hypothetical protein
LDAALGSQRRQPGGWQAYIQKRGNMPHRLDIRLKMYLETIFLQAYISFSPPFQNMEKALILA